MGGGPECNEVVFFFNSLFSRSNYHLINTQLQPMESTFFYDCTHGNKDRSEWGNQPIAMGKRNTWNILKYLLETHKITICLNMFCLNRCVCVTNVHLLLIIKSYTFRHFQQKKCTESIQNLCFYSFVVIVVFFWFLLFGIH